MPISRYRFSAAEAQRTRVAAVGGGYAGNRTNGITLTVPADYFLDVNQVCFYYLFMIVNCFCPQRHLMWMLVSLSPKEKERSSPSIYI